MQSSEKNISGYIHQKHPKCTTFGQVFIEKEGRTDLLHKWITQQNRSKSMNMSCCFHIIQKEMNCILSAGKTENFSSCSHHQWAGVM